MQLLCSIKIMKLTNESHRIAAREKINTLKYHILNSSNSWLFKIPMNKTLPKYICKYNPYFNKYA